MEDNGTLQVWLTALNGTCKVVLLTAVGFYLAHKGQLRKEMSKNLSTIIFEILLPCLLFSSILRTLVNVGLLALWYIPVIAVLFLLLGWVLGQLVCKVTKPPPFFRRACIVACALGNSNQLPVLIMDTLCGFYPSFQQLGSTCRDSATGYISLFLLVFSTVSWTGFYRYLQGSTREDSVMNNGENELYSIVEVYNTTSSFHPSPSMGQSSHSEPMEQSDSYDNIASEKNPSHSFTSLLEKEEHHNSNRAISSMNNTQVLEQSSSLSLFSISYRRLFHLLHSYRHLATPPSIAIVSALLLGTIFKPLALLLIGSDAPLRVVVAAQETLGAAAIALMSLVVGANLYHSYQRGFRNHGVSFFCILSIALCRLFIMPILGWILIELLLHLGILGSRVDNIQLLVMMIETAVPSANNVVIMCEMVGTSEEPISLALLWQFMLAPLFLTANMAFFLWTL
ncbi:hypothetical protein Gasu2_02800 [Galdieria sulphuraria]|uniref:Auxin efflux carrier n=1 Tax=Galdieria sulphuraria TaxID=130081 RepID=M2WZ72_GALSU|nr:auxin efflux carrier [Galdieria sulphuraria]EME29360.1 auxin efflux carrier [Galdieria sulphuraria]GJD05831.1 hypothetical protein Gasu2_02800 [Galdieria sulphuraria]|eukprot:XP_005705880.1 auxin efflux carrier [Galdieria sulphuraria]